MKNLLKQIGEIIIGAIYYGSIIATGLILLACAISTQVQVGELRAGQVEIYGAISDSFSEVVALESELTNLVATVDAASTARDEALAQKIDTVSKDSEARDATLLTLLSASKVDIENELTAMKKKPSVDYLDSITVLIIMKDSADATEGWLGTGVVVKETGDSTYIVTNKHVCDPNKLCWVKEGDDQYPVTVVKRNEAGYDVQIVKVNGHITGKYPVRGVADTRKGDKIYVMGHNLDRPFLYAEGVVAGFQADETADLIIASPTAPGNSGSGVIDADGKLVGLVYAGQSVSIFQMDLTHGLCVNSKVLRLFLAGYLE